MNSLEKWSGDKDDSLLPKFGKVNLCIIEEINNIQKKAAFNKVHIDHVLMGHNEYEKLLQESLDPIPIFCKTVIRVSNGISGVWPMIISYNEQLKFTIG